MSQVQLKGNVEDIAAFRNILLVRQSGLCAICGDPIEIKPKSVHLEHDHKKGHCRGAVHRTCNVTEGKIIRSFERSGSDIDLANFLKGLVEYYEKDFSDNPIHPDFDTELDKQYKKANKLQKLAKRKTAKEKHKQAKKDIKAQINYLDLAA